MRYFARVTAGTEDIAWREIDQLAGIQRLDTLHRRLDFDYSGAPQNLLALRSVDDVYAYVGELHGINHTRAALQTIAQQAASFDFSTALTACRSVRAIPKKPHYTITASLLGGRNYTRYEVAAVLQEAWSRYGWFYVENAPNHAPVDVDIRVLVEQDWLLVGIRLGETPLHRRPYKLHSLPGSLKPPVAYCLCLKADIQPGQTVLDPLCGAGTIPIEAAAFGAGTILAADLNPEAVLSALNNIANAGIDAHVLLADARTLPFADSSIDRIVSNLPWGKQVSTISNLDETYAALVREFARVLPIGGRCVLLTDRGDLLLPPIEVSGCLRVRETQQISLYGSHPAIYSIERTERFRTED